MLPDGSKAYHYKAKKTTAKFEDDTESELDEVDKNEKDEAELERTLKIHNYFSKE